MAGGLLRGTREGAVLTVIREFAVEPESLSRLNIVWQAMEQFGVAHGRLISEFPKGWLRQVYDATANCPPVERKSLEERLARLRHKVFRFRRSRPTDPALTWRNNVHAEDAVEPFHAIIQADNSESHVRVLMPFDLHAENALWQVLTQGNVARTPEAIAAVVGPLGRISSELLFVDPYFSTEARWSKVLVACLKACGVGAATTKRIEFHTGATTPRQFLESGVNQWIVPQIPRGVRVRFVLWKQRPTGEKLHARYFLTERGGIRFDVGLDAGEPGETTDVSLLSDDLYRARWADFQEATAAFDKVDEFTVTGTRV
jgi:hypothetical protein